MPMEIRERETKTGREQRNIRNDFLPISAETKRAKVSIPIPISLSKRGTTTTAAAGSAAASAAASDEALDGAGGVDEPLGPVEARVAKQTPAVMQTTAKYLLTE